MLVTVPPGARSGHVFLPREFAGGSFLVLVYVPVTNLKGLVTRSSSDMLGEIFSRGGEGKKRVGDGGGLGIDGVSSEGGSELGER